MKTCKTCGVSKPSSEFHKEARYPDGHATRCKECKCAAANARYRKKVIEGGKAFRIFKPKKQYTKTPEDTWDKSPVFKPAGIVIYGNENMTNYEKYKARGYTDKMIERIGIS